MYKIGLDLAYNSVGVAIVSNKLLKYKSYELPLSERKKLNEIEKVNRLVNWLFDILNGYILKSHILQIEDVYIGYDPTAVMKILRMQGAVAYKYYSLTGQEVKFIKAISARKLAGANPQGQKVEIQLYIIDKFKLGKVSKEVKDRVIYLRKGWDGCRSKYRSLSKPDKRKYKKEYNRIKNKFKREMSKLSTTVTNETGITEHIADALIITLAL